jgi:hypothetical protein
VSYEIVGANKTERYISECCLKWCIAKFPLNRIKIKVRFANIKSAHGWVEQEGKREFVITISKDYEYLSELTSTILHELIHVKQWVTKEYDGDGEDEADEKAREISNLLWKANLI